MSTNDDPSQQPRARDTSFPVVVPKSGLPVFSPTSPPQVRSGTPVATPASSAVADTLPAPASPPAKKSKARVWVVVLAIVTAALAVLAAYLWVVNEQWQEQNDDLRTQVAALNAQVADNNTQILELQSDLNQAQENLAGATGKVTDLADSSANANDQAAFLTELADSFQQCAQAQASHISHLENASRYTASSLAAEGRDVSNYCSDVEQSYVDYQASLESN
ncbi:hypothetical protein [Demequina oxidasica]|uniref:hypothetical protein n=1 Tax=Demequina oxidasica TaxID=676199 RepID=UPI000782D671|nr:hypothetical protein [Demequina oxidasica]